MSNKPSLPRYRRKIRATSYRAFAMTKIDPSTVRAYLETDYRVSAPAPFILRVGTPCAPLAQLYRQHHTNCGAFVTACNPHSRIVDNHENAARQAELADELARRGLAFFGGVGQHPDGGWPAEPGFLVLGLALAEAKELGGRHDQNAVVWCGPDAVPQLVLLR